MRRGPDRERDNERVRCGHDAPPRRPARMVSISTDNPPSATRSMMSEGKAKVVPHSAAPPNGFARLH